MKDKRKSMEVLKSLGKGPIKTSPIGVDRPGGKQVEKIGRATRKKGEGKVEDLLKAPWMKKL